jgi:hypothetical protein
VNSHPAPVNSHPYPVNSHPDHVNSHPDPVNSYLDPIAGPGMNSCEFPSRSCEFPSRSCEFPSRSCEFPSSSCEFPSRSCEFTSRSYRRSGHEGSSSSNVKANLWAAAGAEADPSTLADLIMRHAGALELTWPRGRNLLMRAAETGAAPAVKVIGLNEQHTTTVVCITLST